MRIWLQNFVSTQPRTSLEKSVRVLWRLGRLCAGLRRLLFRQPFTMPPGTAEQDRSPPRSENQGFRRNYFNFFGNPLTPNSSKFEISPKFCEAFFNPVKFRQIFIKICSKKREIDSKFAKNDEIWWKNCKNKNEKLTNI